jgi:hypothetical protein
MKENTKRNKHRIDVEILDLLVKNIGKEFTTKEVEKEIGLSYSQTNVFLNILRRHISEERPYCKNFSCITRPNPITHIPQYFYTYENK